MPRWFLKWICSAFEFSRAPHWTALHCTALHRAAQITRHACGNGLQWPLLSRQLRTMRSCSASHTGVSVPGKSGKLPNAVRLSVGE
jgi:hypothetical protein